MTYGSPLTETPIAFVDVGSASPAYGISITPEVNLIITEVIKKPSATSTRSRIFTDGYTVLDTATFSGNTATFTGSILLTAGVTYRIENDASGSSHAPWGQATTSFPILRTRFRVLSGSSVGTSYYTNVWGAYSITTQINVVPQMQINIGDSWKIVAGVQINIGNVWKQVAGAQINIGDSWKVI